MAEGAPLKALADLMLLGGEYDRRARYAPTAIAVARRVRTTSAG
jgi:hypothetical protein